MFIQCVGRYSTPTKWKQGNDIVQIVSNFEYSAALSRNGTLGSWGENIANGCNGNYVDDQYCIPDGWDENVSYIHGYADVMCITRKDNTATCVGDTRNDMSDDFQDLPGYSRFGSALGVYDGKHYTII